MYKLQTHSYTLNTHSKGPAHRTTLCGGSGSLLVVVLLGVVAGEGVELGRLAGGAEVGVDLVVELVDVDVGEAVLVGLLLSLGGLPVGAHVVDAVDVVLLGVVVLADAAQALVQRQVLRVDGDAVVLVLAAGADVGPAALLLLEVEAGGVGQEEEGEQHAGQTEPRDDVEAGLHVDVVVQDGGHQGTELAGGGGEAVGGGAHGGGVDLSSDKEGDAVGAELVEEGREEIHGLEGVDAVDARVVIVVEGGHDEEDEVHEEANLHHPLAAVVLVVDEEGWGGQQGGEKEGACVGTHRPGSSRRGRRRR